MLKIKVKPEECSKCPFHFVEYSVSALEQGEMEIDHCAIQDGNYWFKDKVGTGQMFGSVSTCPLEIVSKITVARSE